MCNRIPSHDHPRVDIVDDDQGVRTSLRLLIEAQGWRVREFASCEAFIADMAQRPESPACLVLDIHMPGMNGIELLHFLHDSRRRMIPTIIMTGKPHDPLTLRAHDAGAQAVITKPIDANRLVSAIRRLLERRD